MAKTMTKAVLIDDEASTGATFKSLIRACVQRLPKLKGINGLVITDWMGVENREALKNSGPCPIKISSVLSGSYSFKADHTAPSQHLPDVIGNGQLKDAILPHNYGRLGLRTPPPLPPHITNNLGIKPHKKILVLGTGEFVYLPYVLARFAESCGASVKVQATTRSPILLGGDIVSCLKFKDSYEDGIPNFIYSVTQNQYDKIFVCYETPPTTQQEKLLKHFNAKALYFSHSEAVGAGM